MQVHCSLQSEHPLPCPAALLPAGNIYVQVDFATVCRLSAPLPTTHLLLLLFLLFAATCNFSCFVTWMRLCLSLSLSVSVCVHSSGTHDVPYPLSVRRPLCPVSVVRCPLLVDRHCAVCPSATSFCCSSSLSQSQSQSHSLRHFHACVSVCVCVCITFGVS